MARLGVETAKGLVKVKPLAARRAKVEAIAFGTESQLRRLRGEVETGEARSLGKDSGEIPVMVDVPHRYGCAKGVLLWLETRVS